MGQWRSSGASTKQAWSFHKGRLPVGEHGSILDRRQRSAHYPRPDVQPGDHYLKWVVSETVGGFNAGLMNEDYTDGIICPYEIPDQWQYEYDRQWFVDPTLRFVCTKFRDTEA